MTKVTVLTSVFCMLVSPGIAMPQGQVAQIVKFTERTTTQLHSDLRVRGVLVGELGREISEPVLYLYGVKSGDRAVCVHIERIDGDYSADIEVALRPPTVLGRAVRVDFGGRTKHFERIKTLPSSQVAISAKVPTKGRDCRRTAAHLPTAWHAEGGLEVSVLILNPNARARLVSPDGTECRLLDNEPSLRSQHTTYDTVCALQSMRDCGPLTEVRIRRVATSGQVLEPIAAQLRRLC